MFDSSNNGRRRLLILFRKIYVSFKEQKATELNVLTKKRNKQPDKSWGGSILSKLNISLICHPYEYYISSYNDLSVIALIGTKFSRKSAVIYLPLYLYMVLQLSRILNWILLVLFPFDNFERPKCLPLSMGENYEITSTWRGF